jgi:hypothetical protein
MVPNLVLYPASGKVLFCIADLVAADIVWSLVAADHGEQTGWPALCAALWLFNPLTAAVSTRGNAEALIAVAVLAALWRLRCGRFVSAGVAYGIAVHLKLYPIIYALPTVLHLSPPLLNAFWRHTVTRVPAQDEQDSQLGTMRRRIREPQAARQNDQENVRSNIAKEQTSGNDEQPQRTRSPWRGMETLNDVLTPPLIRFVAGASASFGGATAVSYLLYGWPFVWHTYIYHVTRTDHRHNFSPYFYPLYLAAGGESEIRLGARHEGGEFSNVAITDSSNDGGGVGGVATYLDGVRGGADMGGSTPAVVTALGLAALVPQAVLVAYVGLRRSDDLAVAWLLQTMVFVVFNKVCTAQVRACVLCAGGHLSETGGAYVDMFTESYL